MRSYCRLSWPPPSINYFNWISNVSSFPRTLDVDWFVWFREFLLVGFRDHFHYWSLRHILIWQWLLDINCLINFEDNFSMWGFLSPCNCYNISSIYCMLKNLFTAIGYFVDNFSMWLLLKSILLNPLRSYNVVAVTLTF